MRTLLTTAAVLIITGAAALWFGLSLGTTENWVPQSLPLPPAGATVEGGFHLATGGHFEVQVLTTPNSAEKSSGESRSLPIDAVVTVHGPSGFTAEVRLRQLSTHEWSRDLDFYSADKELALPRGGDYDLAFRSVGVPSILYSRGSMIRIQRSAPFTSRFTSGVVVTLACFALFVATTFVAFAAAMSKQERKSTGTAPLLST